METQPKPRRDTDPWLVFTLSSHSEKLNGLTKEVKKINSGLRDEITNRKMEDVKHDERIDRQRERLDDHKKSVHGNPKPNNPNSSAVTFKWILDKLAVPIVMMLAGGIIALLFGG
jgi:hypothetical protein